MGSSGHEAGGREVPEAAAGAPPVLPPPPPPPRAHICVHLKLWFWPVIQLLTSFQFSPASREPAAPVRATQACPQRKLPRQGPRGTSLQHSPHGSSDLPGGSSPRCTQQNRLTSTFRAFSFPCSHILFSPPRASRDLLPDHPPAHASLSPVPLEGRKQL